MSALVANPVFLAIKAAGAAALAVSACVALGITDLLSAAFVGVLAVSPTVATGLKRAVVQVLGSAAAGLLAAACLWIPVPLAAQVLLAVLVCVGGAFVTGMGTAYQAAAFGALYVLLVPTDTTTHLLTLRMASVLVGCVSALVVNVAVTGLSYERVFVKRATRLQAAVEGVLAQTSVEERELARLDQQVWLVLDELEDALSEARWRPGVPVEALHGVRATLQVLGQNLLEARAAKGKVRVA